MKKIIIFILSLVFCFNLTGCYDSKEISRIAFVIAVGFDKDTYTFQLAKPSAFEGDGEDTSPLLTKKISADNVYKAMDRLNSSISEKCDYSHIKMVIFSEEKLKSGIENDVAAMLKSNDFHPNAKIAMCYGKASEYLEDMEIPLDTNPAEYYENIFNENFTQYSPDTRLKDMQKEYNSRHFGNVVPVFREGGGMAILDNYRLADTADGDEVLIYNIITQKNFEGNYSIDEGTVVGLQKNYCKTRVDIQNKKPVISVEINFEGNIIWSEDGSDTDTLQTKLKEGLTDDITKLLYKASEQYKTDIFDFHKIMKTKYLTTEAWEAEDWQGLFRQADYRVTINADIKRKGLNID